MNPEDVEPHVVRLREDASGWRRVDGPRLTQEDPFLTGLEESEAEALVRSNWALQRSSVEAAQEFYPDEPEPEEDDDGADEANETEEESAGEMDLIDPSEYTVSELSDHLESHEYTDEQLGDLADLERDGKNRETALDAIESTLEG